tara:strand:+ start:12290 stop:12709 length:420 start_codon:yes stop_codon:yes gene_type:complete
MKFKLLLLALSPILFACSNESSNDAKESIQAIKQQDLQKNWQLIQLDNRPIQANSSLNIDDQEKASGNLACNNFFGALEFQENKIRINKMVSTRKMCKPDINVIEMTVSSTLAAWSEVKVSEQKLILTGERHTLTYQIK